MLSLTSSTPEVCHPSLITWLGWVLISMSGYNEWSDDLASGWVRVEFDWRIISGLRYL